MTTFEFADPKAGNPFSTAPKRKTTFQIGKITSLQGSQRLAAAVIKNAIEDYLTEPKNSEFHKSAVRFLLDEEESGFYVDLCPAVTRDVETIRKRITQNRLNAAIDRLRRDRNNVNNAIAYLKSVYEKDIGNDQRTV